MARRSRSSSLSLRSPMARRLAASRCPSLAMEVTQGLQALRHDWMATIGFSMVCIALPKQDIGANRYMAYLNGTHTSSMRQAQRHGSPMATKPRLLLLWQPPTNRPNIMASGMFGHGCDIVVAAEPPFPYHNRCAHPRFSTMKSMTSTIPVAVHFWCPSRQQG